MTFVFFAFEKMYDNLIDSVLKNILGQSGVKDVGAIFLVFKKKNTILWCDFTPTWAIDSILK